MRRRTAFLPLLVVASACWAPAHARPVKALTGAAHGTERGTVVLVHGGSWSANGSAAQATVDAPARRFRRWGWRTVNTDYRAGTAGLRDVVRAVHVARRRGGPVCLYGESSGGHWALLAAAERDVECVIALAAPTDLERLLPWSPLGRIALETFGTQRAAYSPLRRADRIRARVLLAYGADDRIVTLRHGVAMRAALSDAQLDVLAPGTSTWLHGTASTQSVVELLEHERDLLDSVGR